MSQLLSFNSPLDSLHRSILSSSSILASLFSSSTMPYLSLDIIHAFPPPHVDLGSHLSLPLSLSLFISCLTLVTLLLVLASQSSHAGSCLWAMSLKRGQVDFLQSEGSLLKLFVCIRARTLVCVCVCLGMAS